MYEELNLKILYIYILFTLFECHTVKILIRLRTSTVSINPERGVAARLFNEFDCSARKVSRICATLGEHWFRDAARIRGAISIADARKPEIPAIPRSILLFSLPERNPLLHPRQLRCAGSAILSRAFSHSLPSRPFISSAFALLIHATIVVGN